MRANAAHLASNRKTGSFSSTSPADSTTVFDPLPIARCATSILNCLSTDPASLHGNVRFLSAFVNPYWLIRHLDPLVRARPSFQTGLTLHPNRTPKNNSLHGWIPYSVTSCREIFLFQTHARGEFPEVAVVRRSRFQAFYEEKSMLSGSKNPQN